MSGLNLSLTRKPGKLRMGRGARRACRELAPVGLGLALHLAGAWTASAALVSGAYQTQQGATAYEWGDRVPNDGRTVPQSATFRLDLESATPSLSGVITNAVLEGGAPFPLTLRSASGLRLADGSYRFMGDYLKEIQPSQTQYLFDYEVSVSTNGEVVWNGANYWAGGHLWQVTITNLTLVPVPWLEIARVGPAAVELAWATNFAGHVLEGRATLSGGGWEPVTNTSRVSGGRIAVTLDPAAPQRFYRLRGP